MKFKAFFGGFFSVILIAAFVFSMVLTYNNSVLSMGDEAVFRVTKTEDGYEVLGVNLSKDEFFEKFSRFLPHSFKATVLLREEISALLEELLNSAKEKNHPFGWFLFWLRN